MPREYLTFTVFGISLEAVLHTPRDVSPPFPGVLVCHPHPSYGGSMDNNVVTGLCRGLTRAGFAALRYNYRGIGNSEGEVTAGRQDVEDALAMFQHLSERGDIDSDRMAICGYSFGGMVSLRVAAQEPRVRALATVACPGEPLADASLQALTLPKMLISGSRDRIIPVDQFRRLSNKFAEPKEVHIIEGADHFLLTREDRIGDLVGRMFTRWVLEPQAVLQQVEVRER